MIFGEFYYDDNNTIQRRISEISNPDSPFNDLEIHHFKYNTLNALMGVAPSNFAYFRLGAEAGSACDTIVSGVQMVSQKEINVNLYPNPARDILYIDFPYPVGKPYQISIVDVMGIVVYRSSMNAEGGSLPLAQLGLVKGLYVLHAQRDGKGYSRRFVYEK